jgi:hypothetical protein
MIDKTTMLNKLMNVSKEESDLLEWCFLTLDENEIEACLNDAKEIAATELRQDHAANLLTATFVKVIVRCLRWAQLQQQRGGSNPDLRDPLESGVVQQVQNEVQETLLLHAPLTWTDERLDRIEQQVLDHTRLLMETLNTNELRSADFRTEVAKAVAETKRLIRAGGVRS